jgi:intracellular septation protein
MTDAPTPSRFKLALDFGPLLAFLVVYFKTDDFITATAVFMPLIVIAVIVSWKLEGKPPIMPLVTAVIVLATGGLTIYLDDPTFLMMKPTIVYGLLAAALLGGQLAGRSFLRPVMGMTLQLRDEGWRVLTWRFVGFFVFMALLNEVLRRVLTESQWVTFKVFGGIALTIGFMMTQMPLMKRHELPSEAAETDG